MLDLTDVTFLIPIKIDSDERIENLNIVLRYLMTNFDANYLVGEESKKTEIDWLYGQPGFKCIHYESSSNFFHRTKIINNLCKEAKTSIISIYDSDVIMPLKQYINACNMIKTGKLDVVIPYDGTVYNVPKIQNSVFESSIYNQNYLNKIDLSSCKKRRSNSVGGAPFFKREVFIKGGMENENFKSWGAEDDELINRFCKLGFNIDNIPGVLFHMDHSRGKDSCSRNLYYSDNMNELNKVRSMNKEYLLNYIKSWKWIHE